MKKKKKRKYLLLGGMVLAFLSVLTALVLFTDIYLILLGPLECGTDIDNDYGDVILVLGGGLRKGPEIGFSTEERLLQAVELYHRKKRVIIISDGSLYPRSPAIQKITGFLVRKGVEPQHIRLEGKSQTTLDNLINSMEIIRELKPGKVEIIVCTSPYHQKRAQVILGHLKTGNFKIARMKSSEIDHGGSVKQRLRNLWLIMREYLAILKFKISGK
jgi:uncharacterized SAM-binding protein YcdF (DUF218 family)